MTDAETLREILRVARDDEDLSAIGALIRIVELADAALQRLADLPAARSGVITSGVRLTDEEDSKALWLTRRLMPQEPKR